jgi:hypothetical protein
MSLETFAWHIDSVNFVTNERMLQQKEREEIPCLQSKQANEW